MQCEFDFDSIVYTLVFFSTYVFIFYTFILKYQKIILGNLNIFSFRHVSEYDDTVALTDLSFNENYDDFMGHANKES